MIRRPEWLGKLLKFQRPERRLAVVAGEFLAYIWPTQRRMLRILRIYSPLNL
jgi:hypothetical protein